MDLDKKTRTNLLRFGILTMSLSDHNIPMTQAVSNFLSDPPNNSVSAIMSQRIGESGYSKVQPTNVLFLLNAFIEGENSRQRVDWRTISANILAMNWVIVATTMVLVIMKLALSWLVKGRFGREDPLLVASALLTYAFAQVVYFDAASNPTCEHVWNVSYNQFNSMLKGLYDAQILHVLANHSAKTAILIFYWGIIPANKSMRRVKQTIIFCILGEISMAILAIGTVLFQCRPRKFWIDPVNMKCIPRMQIWVPLGVVVVVINLVCLLLPVKIVWSLGLTNRQKAMVTGLFALGALAWAASIVRIIEMLQFIDNPDLTLTQCDSTIPSILEGALTIDAACIPSVKALLSTYIPRLSSRVRNEFRRGRLRTTTGVHEIIGTMERTRMAGVVRRLWSQSNDSRGTTVDLSRSVMSERTIEVPVFLDLRTPGIGTESLTDNSAR